MWAALKKLIACVLVASLILPVGTATAVPEKPSSSKEPPAKAASKEPSASEETTPICRSGVNLPNLDLGNIDTGGDGRAALIIIGIVIVIVVAAVIVESIQNYNCKKAKTAKQQAPPENAGPESAQKQRPGGQAGLGWSPEDPHPGFRGGYVPPDGGSVKAANAPERKTPSWWPFGKRRAENAPKQPEINRAEKAPEYRERPRPENKVQLFLNDLAGGLKNVFGGLFGKPRDERQQNPSDRRDPEKNQPGSSRGYVPPDD